MKKYTLILLSACVSLIPLSGCVGVVAGGAATSAVIAHDSRTPGTFIEDQTIEFKGAGRLRSDLELNDKTNISVTSYNQHVLLTGQAPDTELQERAGRIIAKIEKVNHVYNEIEIAAPISFLARSNDGLITAKVKTKLLGLKDFQATRVKVVTESGVVYLMGFLAPNEANAVATLVSKIGGVKKVVKLFEEHRS